VPSTRVCMEGVVMSCSLGAWPMPGNVVQAWDDPNARPNPA
jgi:hypothetical protein